MDGQRQGADPSCGREDVRAVPARRVRHELARVDGAGVDESGDQAGEDVVRHGEQDEVGVGDHLGHRQHGHAGKQGVCPEPGHVGHRGDADDVVTGPPQRRTEDGAHASGPHDPDAQPRRMCSRHGA